MTPRLIRILTECDTMLTDITRRYTTATHRLTDAEPGYPAHTPGNGEPGHGKGFTAGSITDRLAVTPHPELDAAERLRNDPHLIAANANYFAEMLNLPRPEETNSPRWPLQLLVWSRWIIRRTLHHELDAPSQQFSELHRSIDSLHRTVTTWGTPATTPTKKTQPHEMPDDLTGMWCRSCLRIGARSPRRRGDRCSWCYEFERTEGFTPPPELLEKHERGTVYDRDVEPFRRAFKDRKKQKRKSVRR